MASFVIWFNVGRELSDFARDSYKTRSCQSSSVIFGEIDSVELCKVFSTNLKPLLHIPDNSGYSFGNFIHFSSRQFNQELSSLFKLRYVKVSLSKNPESKGVLPGPFFQITLDLTSSSTLFWLFLRFTYFEFQEVFKKRFQNLASLNLNQ